MRSTLPVTLTLIWLSPSLSVFFPIGSVPTRSMIAFFRDRDPAGRSEPEGMESTSPSTNDVDMLSSSTLAVASLVTPAPSLQEETPHEEVEHRYLWRCFPDYIWSQRVRDTPSWVWGFGYDVEDSSGGRRWVCRRCIQNKNPKPQKLRGESRMRTPIYSRAMEYALPLTRRNQPLRKKPRN